MYINQGGEKKEQEGISHVLKELVVCCMEQWVRAKPSPTRVLLEFSFSQEDTGFSPCMTAWTTSASPAEIDGMNRGLKHPEATPAFCKVFRTKKLFWQCSSKVITVKGCCSLSNKPLASLPVTYSAGLWFKLSCSSFQSSHKACRDKAGYTEWWNTTGLPKFGACLYDVVTLNEGNLVPATTFFCQAEFESMFFPSVQV